MPLAISLAHQLAKRLAHVRKENILDYLRPDGKTQVTIEYDESDQPIRVDTLVISTQHRQDIDTEQIEEDIIEHVINPVVPSHLLDDKRSEERRVGKDWMT